MLTDCNRCEKGVEVVVVEILRGMGKFRKTNFQNLENS